MGQIEKVVEPLADTKEVEQIHSDEEDKKKETNDEAVESKDSKPELTKEQKENDHKMSVIKDDISDNEKVKESNAPQDEQNLDVKDSSRRESDYKPDSSVSDDEKKDKKETKKLRRESTESSSDDKSVSSSSEGDAEKEKNDVQETLHDEEKDEKKILVTDGELVLEIIEASNLVNKDIIGKSDPFVRVSFNKEEFKSKKVRNNLEPKWNFPVTLQIDPAKAENNIEIKVYDDDFGAENFIGSYYLPVKEAIHNSGVGGVWYDLRDCKNGKICVSTQFNASDSKINKKEIVGMSQEEKAKENFVPEEKQNIICKDTDLSTETSKEKEEGIAKSKEVDSKIDSKEQLLDAKEGEMINEKEEQTKNEKHETEEIKEKTSQRDEKKKESLIKTENGEESKPTEKADVKEVNETDNIYSKRDDDVENKGEVPNAEQKSTDYMKEKIESEEAIEKEIVSKDKDIDVSNENQNTDLINAENVKENEMKEKKDSNDVKQTTTDNKIFGEKEETKIKDVKDNEKDYEQKEIISEEPHVFDRKESENVDNKEEAKKEENVADDSVRTVEENYDIESKEKAKENFVPEE